MELALFGVVLALALAGTAAMLGTEDRVPVRIRAKDGRRSRRP
ncbi:MAG TPA: hypothetical protein VGE72_02035 [Azospirillum sp.]